MPASMNARAAGDTGPSRQMSPIDRTKRGDSGTVDAPNKAAASACGRGRTLAPAPATTSGTIASR